MIPIRCISGRGGTELDTARERELWSLNLYVPRPLLQVVAGLSLNTNVEILNFLPSLYMSQVWEMIKNRFSHMKAWMYSRGQY